MRFEAIALSQIEVADTELSSIVQQNAYDAEKNRMCDLICELHPIALKLVISGTGIPFNPNAYPTSSGCTIWTMP